jgi:hypothetical protein
MMARTKQLTAKLDDSRVLTLSGVDKLSVKCTGGAVWVTSGDGRELALSSGKRGRMASAATVAIQGVPDGEVRVTWR